MSKPTSEAPNPDANNTLLLLPLVLFVILLFFVFLATSFDDAGWCSFSLLPYLFVMVNFLYPLVLVDEDGEEEEEEDGRRAAATAFIADDDEVDDDVSIAFIL